jgi:hypothetical protein
MGVFRNFQFANGSGQLFRPVAIEVAPGDCDNLPNTYITVYRAIPEQDIATAEPQPGEVLYTDIALTQPYDGQSLEHRIRYFSLGQTIMSPRVFKVGSAGIIGPFILLCQLAGVENLAITNSINTTGFSCWELTASVPMGEVRELSVFKTGLAPYIGNTIYANGCTPGELNITSNTVIQLPEGLTTITVGIFCEEGNSSLQTSIAVALEGGNQVTLTRAHSNPPTYESGGGLD